MYTDSFHVQIFLYYLIGMTAVWVGTWANIGPLNDYNKMYEKFIYESRERICLKKMYRFFPCYDKQKPHLILKKVFVLQSIWYGFILLTLISGAATVFLEERIVFIVYAIVFFPFIGFACHTGPLKDKAIKDFCVRFKLNETNEK